MFNLKHFKLVKELKNLKPVFDWIKFSGSKNTYKAKEELLNSIIADNKFVREDLKIRNMVEDMLQKEFSPDIKKIKSYDFLVDSVVNKLKQKQLGDVSYSLDDIE